MSITSTLKSRGKRYGKFVDHAVISQDLQDVMRDCRPNGKEVFSKLEPIQKEALMMIQHKVARILNGDPNYADNWHDIQGYAKLVEDWIES